MNLWFRLLWLLACTPFRPRLSVPLGVSRLSFGVWPLDLDINGHMNNGRYWTIFDLGRLDLILRTGLLRAVLKQRWAPMVGTGAIRFRRELRPFQRFVLETRLVAWTGTRIVLEHRILTGEGDEVATRALLLAGFYDRRARQFVAAQTLLDVVGAGHVESPPLDAATLALIEADTALRDEGAPSTA